MKGLTVYLRLEPYLRQWLTHNFGSPVRFPPRSYENMLLHRLLSRPAAGATTATGPTCPPDSVAIVITDHAQRRPEYWCHLSRRAQAEMARAVANLFCLALWSECVCLIHSGTLNRGIDSWCQANGIALIYREGVRQKFYRMRRLYAQNGVILGKKYTHASGNNHTHTTHP